jgi:glycosyltransferase involved in cell wall biosynthesis
MRIAIVSSTAVESPPKRYGGLERVAYDLARDLAELGHDVTLFAKPGSQKPGAGNLVEVQDEWDALGDGFDILHSHGWKMPAWKLLHDDPNARALHTWHGENLGLRFPNLPRLNLVGISKFQADMLSAWTGRDVPYVYNGVDLDLYPLYTGERGPDPIYINRVSPEKGLHVAALACNRAGLGLDIVGTERLVRDPEYVGWMMRQCDGVRFRFWGEVGHEVKLELLQRARCLVWATPGWEEPFGLGPCEAMAVGTPVVALRRGALNETIREGGILVDSIGDLEYAIGEASRIAPEACRANAERFSIRRMTEGYLGLYQRLLENGGW